MRPMLPSSWCPAKPDTWAPKEKPIRWISSSEAPCLPSETTAWRHTQHRSATGWTASTHHVSRNMFIYQCTNTYITATLCSETFRRLCLEVFTVYLSVMCAVLERALRTLHVVNIILEWLQSEIADINQRTQPLWLDPTLWRCGMAEAWNWWVAPCVCLCVLQLLRSLWSDDLLCCYPVAYRRTGHSGHALSLWIRGAHAEPPTEEKKEISATADLV